MMLRHVKRNVNDCLDFWRLKNVKKTVSKDAAGSLEAWLDSDSDGFERLSPEMRNKVHVIKYATIGYQRICAQERVSYCTR